jgi:hypothetical protein
MADLTNRSFTAFAGLRPNQGAALGLSPGDQADLVTIAGPNGAKFTVARKVAPQFNAFLSDLGGKGYLLNPKTSGGYNNRTIAGSPRLSQHAFGNAIDLNWDINPRGSAKHNLPPDVGELAGKHGLVWGGTFSNPDPMHFEASRIVDGLPAYGAPASSHMAGNAVNAVNNGEPRSMASPIGGAPIAGGPVPLTAPNMRYSKLADALLASAAGAKPKGWGDLLNSAGDLALGYTLSDKADKQQSAYKGSLAQALMGANDTDSMARTLMSTGDDDLVKQGVALKVAQAKPQSQVGRFRPSKQGVVDTMTGQIVPGTEQSGADAAEYGTTPVPYTDKDGNLRYTQMSKAGGRKDVELDEGAKWAPGYDFKDTGTEFTGLNRKTGAAGPAIAKNIAGKEAAEEVGKLGGQAQVALPAAKTMVDNAFKTIGELRAHPGLNVGTGASNVFDPRSWIPGTDSYDFQAKNKQATGQSFMVARDALKGAGQVTDFEGAKGEQAIANLDVAQSKEQYLAALGTLEQMMRASYSDLEKKAAGGRPQAAPSPDQPKPVKTLRFNPQTGEIE